MNKFILGSGIVALIARDILGPEWKIIPFYRSRFYTFNPSLDDNYIIRNSDIDFYVKTLGSNMSIYNYKKAYSIKGMIYDKHDENICNDWAFKMFGGEPPSHILSYMKHNISFDVYDIRVNQLYSSLQEKYSNEINSGLEYGKLLKISGHTIVCENKTVQYDKIVSTIPLNALCGYSGTASNLVAKDAHFIHLHTDHLDFEGNNQLFAVDSFLPFYKVTNVAEKRYMFYFNEPLENPGPFFMSLLRDFDILDGTSVKNYLVTGERPNLDHFEADNIFCVGSYAQWDWCMDVSSCILRIVKYSQRDLKEKKSI